MGTETDKLASTIGGNKKDTNNLTEDAFPDDQGASLLIAPIDGLKITVSVVGNYLNYPTTSFILDHLVYSDLDSSTLSLDGGYDSTTAVAWSYDS